MLRRPGQDDGEVHQDRWDGGFRNDVAHGFRLKGWSGLDFLRNFVCLQLVVVFFVASCQLATEEASRMKGLAYKLSLRSLDAEDGGLQVKLGVLSDLHEYRKPRFTAAGYFEINYGLLLTICGYVTTNIIIALSFKI